MGSPERLPGQVDHSIRRSSVEDRAPVSNRALGARYIGDVLSHSDEAADRPNDASIDGSPSRNSATAFVTMRFTETSRSSAISCKWLSGLRHLRAASSLVIIASACFEGHCITQVTALRWLSPDSHYVTTARSTSTWTCRWTFGRAMALRQMPRAWLNSMAPFVHTADNEELGRYMMMVTLQRVERNSHRRLFEWSPEMTRLVARVGLRRMMEELSADVRYCVQALSDRWTGTAIHLLRTACRCAEPLPEWLGP